VADRRAAELRYERKFVTFELGESDVATVVRLHPALFREIHHARQVNNVYFDTPSFDHYEANVRGIARRLKCRIRWYGEALGPIGRPTLEIKRKQGLVGSKESHPLPPFSLDGWPGVAGIFEKSELPGALKQDVAPLRPMLLNRYWRRYFLSCDGRYRITLDWGLGFRALAPGPTGFASRGAEDRRVIVELKFGLESEQGAPAVASQLPFRLSRCSKYVVGIDALYG
jgi:hypothetical protein